MWMIVMFDLPVVEEKERKEATKFRTFLLKQGFSMSQYSVYAKFIGTRDHVDAQVAKIKSKLPHLGKVSMLFFTDKQYSNIINYCNAKPKKKKESNQMLLHFD